MLDQKVDKLKPVNVLDHGYVVLHSHMGNDLSVVNAARQSFGASEVEMNERNKGLINFLMRERHGTPFEMVAFTFNIKLPIFVMRELIRHRIASYNEYSGRYTKMISDFYVPSEASIRTQTGKPGSYIFLPIEKRKAKIVRAGFNIFSKVAYKLYEFFLDMGVAKEVARMILPVNYYTQFTWTINLRSLFNFISLRSDETAMYEIRQYSQTIETMISEIVPECYRAFIKNGRKSP